MTADSASAATVPAAIPAAATDRVRNLVGGEWVVPAGVATVPTADPATGAELAEVPLSGAADVGAAVAAAGAAQPVWAATSPLDRARALMALREALVAEREALARLVTLDMGKTLADARAEVGRGIESVEAATAIPHLLKGEALTGVARGVDVELLRQPVGVVAAISPFNFPAMIPLWFLPFAIGCGNAIVLKPSEQDPLAAVRIAEIANAVEAIPAGVVNLVNGGRDAVNALLDHPGVDAVSFVGSAATARHVASRAVATGKRFQALGGAKNSLVVMPDAEPAAMVEGVLGSAFGAAGQRCLAGSVAVLVGQPAEQDGALEALVAGARALTVGAGADPATDVCPLIGPASRERVEAEIDAAVAAGARLVLDGRRGGGRGGAELGPTVLDGGPPEGRALREELFGPVLSVLRAPDLNAAIEWANASRYGNAAVIFTADGGAARAFRTRIAAGMVGVNVGVAAPVAWFPFSGWNDSIDGDLHANGRDAVEFYTRKKVVTTRWP
ncbi:MAG: CoA-acylating methylmalonate-semialdehyde dehydrogenase [Solirubrobacterales bacterium]|nr:CoA-acylating methylmalonate-semialdehyde dehydrogenase [Solirubrobacterales bacterium]